jgi:hypothetical protein
MFFCELFKYNTGGNNWFPPSLQINENSEGILERRNCGTCQYQTAQYYYGLCNVHQQNAHFNTCYTKHLKKVIMGIGLFSYWCHSSEKTP